MPGHDLEIKMVYRVMTPWARGKDCNSFISDGAIYTWFTHKQCHFANSSLLLLEIPTVCVYVCVCTICAFVCVCVFGASAHGIGWKQIARRMYRGFISGLTEKEREKNSWPFNNTGVCCTYTLYTLIH